MTETNTTPSTEPDRYLRLREILPVDEIRRSFAVVGGVGALGNEVTKNLALLGVGHILICDLDDVEIHNVTRSVLFRASDTGRMKAEVAAERVCEINPAANVIPFPHNIAELGLGVFRRADFVFTTFDAFFPRYIVNEACMRIGKPWIDAGMSALDHRSGSVVVYDPRDPDNYCYTCRASPEVVSEHLAGLRGQMGCGAHESRMDEVGGVPTTPMGASLIGSLQTQAGLEIFQNVRNPDYKTKWSSGEFRIDAASRASRVMRKKRHSNCYYHDRMGIEPLRDQIHAMPDWDSETTTGTDVLERAKADLGHDRVSLVMPEIYMTRGHCTACHRDWDVFKPMSTYRMRIEGKPCPECGEGVFESSPDWAPVREFDADFSLIDRPLRQLGVRLLDVIQVVALSELGDEEGRILYEITGDAARLRLPG